MEANDFVFGFEPNKEAIPVDGILCSTTRTSGLRELLGRFQSSLMGIEFHPKGQEPGKLLSLDS